MGQRWQWLIDGTVLAIVNWWSSVGGS